MHLNVREIKTEDFSTCANILVEAYNGEPWNNSWTKKEALLRIEATMSGFNSRGYVIEQNNKIISMCLGRIDYYYGNWSQFCIDEFNVLPSLQGKGIGGRLLQFVTNVMKDEQINKIFLMTGGKQAAQFYTKQGFVTSHEGSALEYDLQNN
ncbi:GNAT family N-acetyltransferase [Enterococcus eurekensis]|uniref:GNAT family N-acetyltransferase n=1 Tax=Enterococcus eurekensis TaxID=1159753 RepID=A0ABV9M5G7_9ENTE